MDAKTLKNRRIKRFILIHIAALISASFPRCAARTYTAGDDISMPVLFRSFESPTRITIGNESNYGPSLSPNGAHMFYTSDRTGNKDIFAKRTRGGYASPLTSHPADDFSPVMSPDGGLIAFVSRRSNAAGSIHIMKSGQSLSKITSSQIEGNTISINLPDLELRNPAWFPNSKKIVFSGKRSGEKIPTIFAATVTENPEIKAIYDVHGDYPSVSNNGKMITYARSGAIFIFNLTENKEIKLTTGNVVQDGHPQFTPDDNGIIFIRYADDTNDDANIDATDRPTIWSLNIEKQKSEPENLENFYLKPLSSAQFTAFYPRIHGPYIYFASQDSDSLDIYRLPEAGHTKKHNTIKDTLVTFEQLNDEHDKTYLLRHDTSVAFYAKDSPLASKLALMELEWLTELHRNIEAKWLAAKITRTFHEDPNVLAAADLISIEGNLSSWRFPDSGAEITEDRRHTLKQWVRIVAGIIDDSAKVKEISADTRAQAFYVRAELTATLGDYKKSESLLTQLVMEYKANPRIASKALHYRAKLESARDRHDLALNTVLEMITQFPTERTRATAASIDLTTAIKLDDPLAINKLAHIRDVSDKLQILPAYAEHRMIAVWRAQGKHEAANREMRSLIKRATGTPLLAMEIAEELINLEEAAGRQSSALGIIRDVRPLIAKSDPESKKRLRLMEASLRVRRGRTHLYAGEIGFAVKEFQAAQQAWPTDLSAQVGIIDARDQRGEISTIIADFESLISHGSNNPDMFYLLSYAKQKQTFTTPKERLSVINDCLGLLETARQLNGNVPQYHLLLGKLFLEKAHIRRAQLSATSGTAKMSKAYSQFAAFIGFPEPNWFELSIESSLTAFYLSTPKSIDQADLSLQMGDTYFENENYHLSLRHYLRRLDMLSTLPIGDSKKELRLYRHAGRAAFYAQELNLADVLQRKAYQLAKAYGNVSDIAYSLDSLALTLRDQKKYEAAKEIYDELLKIQIKNNDQTNAANTHVNLGYTYFMLSNYSLALQEYEIAESEIERLGRDNFRRKKESITIDLGGQNSAALGFTKTDRLIQVTAFKARIYEAMGENDNALKQLNKKARLLNEKLESGKKLGITGAYMAEELSVCYNNIGSLLNQQGELEAATTNFTTSLDYAKKLRIQGQAYPARPEWLSLLNLARNQLQRADLKSISSTERTKIERDIDDALTQFEVPLKGENREAMLAVAALKGVSAQLMSIDTTPGESRYNAAQTRFQDSIILAQKLGITSNFEKSANLNLDRGTADSRADKDDIFAAHINFRKSAMINPSLSWKYLASQGLCHQAIASVTNYVTGGAHIPGNDLNLIRNCVDKIVEKSIQSNEINSKNDNILQASFDSLRRYYYILAQSYANEKICTSATRSRPTSAVPGSEIFPLGRFERLGASLETKDGLLIARPTSAGINMFLLTRGVLSAKKIIKDKQPGSSPGRDSSTAQLFDESIRQTERIYIVPGENIDIINEPSLREMLTGKKIAFIPAPDLLPKLTNIRPVGVSPEILQTDQVPKLLWRGYLDRLIAGRTGTIAFSTKLTGQPERTLPDSFYEKTPHDAILNADPDAIIIGYMGPSRRTIEESAQKLIQNALNDASKASYQSDLEKNQMYAKEAYIYSVVSGDLELRYKSATLVIDSIIKSGLGDGLSYFKEQQKIISLELNKAHPINNDLDAAEAEVKRRNPSEAKKILNSVRNDLNKSGSARLRARFYQIQSEVFLQDHKFSDSVKALDSASAIFKSTGDFSSAAITATQSAKIYQYFIHDNKAAIDQLSVAEDLYRSNNDEKGRFESRIKKAHLFITVGQLAAAKTLMKNLSTEKPKELSVLDQVEVKFLEAELSFLEGNFKAIERHVAEIQNLIPNLSDVEHRQKTKIRLGKLKGWMLGSQNLKDESIATFNQVLVEARKLGNALLEQEIKRDYGLLLRHWGDASESASQFEDSIGITNASIKDNSMDSELTADQRNLALSLGLSGDIDKAKLHASEAITIAEKNRDQVGRLEALIVMADIAMIETKNKMALGFLNEALEKSKSIKAPEILWKIQYGLGVLNMLAKNHEKASAHLAAALDLTQSHPEGHKILLTSSDSITGATTEDLTFWFVKNLIKSDQQETAWSFLKKKIAMRDKNLKTKLITDREYSTKSRESFLPDDTKIIYYLAGRKSIIAFVVSNHDIKTALLEAKSSLIFLDTENVKGTTPTRLKSVSDLSTALIAPLEQYIRDTKNLIIVSGPALQDVPFSALNSSGKPLIDQLKTLTFWPTIHYATPEPTENEQSRRELKLLGALTSTDKDSYFSKERTTITRFFPSAQILEGKTANNNALRSEIGHEDILHISAKAVTNNLEANASYFQLYPMNSAENRWGIAEILETPTKRNLVFLIQPVSSEVFAESFQGQGTQTVITNTGPSDDTQSLFLAKNFYKNYLAGKNACYSLRQAQVTTRKYFPGGITWANFRLYGACK